MRLRRVVPLLLIAVMVAGFLAGCKAQETGTQPVDPYATITAIQRKGKIVIGTSSGYFPFEMVDKNGNLIGFDIDMGKKIAKLLGVTVEWRDMDEFAALIPSLELGQLDLVIAGMTIRADRALTVNYTIPYFTTGQAVLVNKNVRNITKVQDLDKKGMIVAVASGTTGHNAAERVLKQATIRVMDDEATAGLEVLSGKAHAMVFDLDWITIFHWDNPDTTYALLEPFTVEYLGIAVRPSQWDLLNWLNTFLTEFVGNEEYQELYQYYFKDTPWKLEMPGGG